MPSKGDDSRRPGRPLAERPSAVPKSCAACHRPFSGRGMFCESCVAASGVPTVY